MKKIIIDTNFWLIPFQLKVDIFSEIDRLVSDKYEIYIINKTLEELNNIMKRESGKTKQAAKYALVLIEKKSQTIIKTDDLDVDASIINLCKLESYIVATQDNLLKKNLSGNIIVLKAEEPS